MSQLDAAYTEAEELAHQAEAPLGRETRLRHVGLDTTAAFHVQEERQLAGSRPSRNIRRGANDRYFAFGLLDVTEMQIEDPQIAVEHHVIAVAFIQGISAASRGDADGNPAIDETLCE